MAFEPQALVHQVTDHGVLVAFGLPPEGEAAGQEALIGTLLAEERALTGTFARRRLITFAGGRFALRAALSAVGGSVSGPILPDGRGAPKLPFGFRGSISHKDDIACALVQPGEAGHIGVDVEGLDAPSLEVARLVATQGELAKLASLPPGERRQRIARTFALKEALYKGLDPFVHRYVGFHEVEVEIGEGTAEFRLNLAQGEGPFSVDARWFDLDRWVLASVRVRLP